MSDAAARGVSLAPGTDDSGLAWMLAELVRVNLAQDPGKRRDFERLDAVVIIEARDAEVIVTMEFARGFLTVHAEERPGSHVRISADSRTILEFARLKIVLGLPMVLGRQGRALLREMLEGSVRISPVRGNVGTLLRLTRLLSVRL